VRPARSRHFSDRSSSTPDNFIRAETDLYFSRIVADNGFGKFTHNRELTPHTIGNFLPTHAAILALRGVIIGSTIAVTGVLQLAAWLVVGALASVLITEQRRALTSKQLRLGSVLSPAT
jgi:hypothetical protein